MHTPDQAKALWCPMVRLAASDGSNVRDGQTVMNRLQNGNNTAIPDSARCIADKCAMWRWGEYETKQLPKVVPDPIVAGGHMLTTVPFKVPVAGYCGMAGVPK